MRRLINNKSTDDGWYFVSRGTGGITSVLRANRIVTVLLQKEQRQMVHYMSFSVCMRTRMRERETEGILGCI